MSINYRYTCVSSYKLEYSIPEQIGLSFSRKSKYVVCQSQKYDSKFPKPEKSGKQMHKSQRQKG